MPESTQTTEIERKRPRLLDLYCCGGGAGYGYHLAGFEVVGVDIDPQPNYPFEFHQADALEYLAEHGHEYAAIHTSPPCQRYLNLGAVNRKLGRTYDHPDLIGPTRELLADLGKPYVIENVEDGKSQLIDPVRVCGTGLGRPLRRHRLFESNVPLEGIACDHKRYSEPRYWTGWRPKGEHRLSTVVQIYGNAGGREHWPAALGADGMTAEGDDGVRPAVVHRVVLDLLDRLARAEGAVARCAALADDIERQSRICNIGNTSTITTRLRAAIDGDA